MKRRDILKGVGVAAAAAGLAACQPRNAGTGAGPAAGDGVRLQWKMVTSWPTNFPGLGAGAARLAEQITRASGGRITVRVFGSGELVPPFEVFDAVSRGTAEMGHTAAYYWRGKAAAAPFFCAVPFGLNAQEMDGWLRFGGGLELWRELYAPFNLMPFAAGNTGVQLAGWFRRPIAGVGDLRGLRMRIPGLGGDVIARLGAVPVNLPGAEIFSSLQSGAIDAAEWVGPYNDLAFGLHRVAGFAYYPGWQEPGATLEAIVHKPAFDALPEDLKAIVEACCAAENDAMLAEYTARNQQALDTLIREHGVQLRRLPDDVLAALRRAAEAVLEELAAGDPFARRAYDSMRAFRAQAQAWHTVSEEAFFQARR
jgi:TRAP-type mannitol/chloroaromatic compound transport system substrate-binding protein